MFRAAAIVLNGSIFAQILSLAFLPIISRQYSPESFGEYQTFFSALLTLLPLAALRYEFAILRVRGEGSLWPAVLLCLAISLGTATIAGVVLCGLRLLFLPSIPIWFVVALPVALLAAAALQTIAQVPVRGARYLQLSVSRVLQSTGFNGLAATAGMVPGLASAWMLVCADIMGRVLSAAYLFRTSAAERGWFRRVPVRRLRVLASAFREYPLYSVPGSLASALGQSLPVFFLVGYYGSEEAGYYGMASRISLLPIGMLGFALSQVVNARVSAMHRSREDGIRRLVARLLAVLASFAVVLALMIVLAAEPLVVFVLGDAWLEAGQLLTVLAPMLVVAFIRTPLNTVLAVIGQQRVHLIWELARLATLVSVFGWLLGQERVYEVSTMMSVYSWIVACSGIVYILLVLWLAGRR